MHKFLLLFCIIIIGSCNAKTTFDATVNFEKIEVEKQGGKLKPDSAYEVSAEYYNPTNAPVFLKDSILKHTKLLFASWFDLKGQFDLNASVKKHFDEYCKQITENNLPAYIAFILNIAPEDVYQNEHIISFTYNWMVYEGGAHPNSGKYCFVVDKNTGRKVSYKSLIKGGEAEFLSIAETEFKTQSGINPDEKIPEPYRFKDGKFHLADNYRVTSKGLVFYYDPYEIAPYSFGIIELKLPYEKIERLIKWNLK
ncbi:MAG: DUF3298 and DUF4163 domain-containing protein [Prevotellaceae bacterium]|jgi:hypothetical protein|nr:DUF3298 and DUF4163 domain-containing protein [Prevotellaceae bacterium]